MVTVLQLTKLVAVSHGQQSSYAHVKRFNKALGNGFDTMRVFKSVGQLINRP